jgi:hypothetical protein
LLHVFNSGFLSEVKTRGTHGMMARKTLNQRQAIPSLRAAETLRDAMNQLQTGPCGE